jgi:lipoprotein-anchoring transpeptidase ErfK/SrfK
MRNTCIILLVALLPLALPAQGKDKKAAKETAGAMTASPAPVPGPTAQSAASPSAGETTPAPSTTGSPSVTLPPTDEQTILRLQVFLDQQGFRPGKIDGRWGEFCGKALERYERAKGRSPEATVDPATQQELEKLTSPLTDYKITPEDLKQVGTNVPRTPAGESKLKFVPYGSMLEFVAEKFHSDPGYIAKINPGAKLNRLKTGDSIKVPAVTPFEVEKLQKGKDLPANASLTQRLLKVDTRAKMLDVLDGTNLIASYPITPGSKALPAPIGTWKVVRLTTLPIFRWDKEMLNHGNRSGDFYNVPPGPRNMVGIAWIGINKKGIGLHGTNNPDTIGRAASHGCIRLSNWDINSLLGQVTVGNTVEIF